MKHIALAGKGSSGKSALAALWATYGLRGRGRVLVVDADPHGTLTRLLGLQPPATLGGLRSKYEREFKTGAGLPPDETRESLAERAMVNEAIVRAPAFDFLALGRWDLPGSQCVPNRVLGLALAALAGQYDVVLTDNEAGIEHIGRFADTPIDWLWLVAQPDPLFLDVARQVLTQAQASGRTVRAAQLVLNQAEPADVIWAQQAQGWQACAITALPVSPALRALSRAGHSPVALPPADPWRTAALTLFNAAVR
jgi:CO dehydrogenase maturation factor